MGRRRGENWAKWLEKRLGEDERPHHFELRSRGSEGATIAIDSWKPDPGDSFDSIEVWDKVSEFLAAAQDDVNGFEGEKMAYAVFAVDEMGDVLGRSGAVVFHNDNVDEQLDTLEPATSRGFFGQMMRHNEGYAKLAMGSLQAQNEQLTRIVTMFMENQGKIEQRRIESWERFEEASSLKHERDLQMQAQKDQKAMQQQVVAQLTPHIPVLAAKLLSSLSQGNAPTGDETRMLAQTVCSVFDGLPPDRQKALAEALGPEYGGALSEVLQAAKTMAGEPEAAE